MVNQMGYIPSFIRYHKDLSPQVKLLYAELTAMIGIDGKCDIDLKHLTRTFNCNNNNIKVMLNSLFTIGAIEKDGRRIVLPNNLVIPKKEYLKGVDSKFIDEVIAHWNKLFKSESTSGIRRTPALIKALTERQSSFTNDEIMSALTNRHSFVCNSDWHQQDKNKPHRLNILLALKDDDRLQEFLNLEAVPVSMKRATKAVAKEKVDKSFLE